MIIITNFPSFYKINLYNKIFEKREIEVIFLGKYSKYRFKSFSKFSFKFKSKFLSKEFFEKRIKFLSLIYLWIYLLRTKENKLVITGWGEIEFWLAALFFKRKKTLILESNIYDSSKSQFKHYLKKFFLFFINEVIICGSHQKKLLDYLGYKKKIITSKGVGIINKENKIFKDKKFKKNFLYIGRLEKEKNILYLLSIFYKHRKYNLSIVGNGSLREQILKKISNVKNIKYYKKIDNKNIIKIFKKNCLLILPSVKEPWGLVVEESIFFKTPVILSKYCGVSEVVKNKKNGFIFNPNQKGSLEKILKNLNNQRYSNMIDYINKNPLKNDQHQINSYLKI